MTSSRNQVPAQRTEPGHFEDAFRADIPGSAEVGGCARDLSDAVLGAGGEVHLLHGLFEAGGGGGVELA